MAAPPQLPGFVKWGCHKATRDSRVLHGNPRLFGVRQDPGGWTCACVPLLKGFRGVFMTERTKRSSLLLPRYSKWWDTAVAWAWMRNVNRRWPGAAGRRSRLELCQHYSQIPWSPFKIKAIPLWITWRCSGAEALNALAHAQKQRAVFGCFPLHLNADGELSDRRQLIDRPPPVVMPCSRSLVPAD